MVRMSLNTRQPTLSWTGWRVGIVLFREKRVAVVNARQDKRDNKFDSSLSGCVFSDLTDCDEEESSSPEQWQRLS